MRSLTLVVATATLLACSGCASIVSTSSRQVTISSNPIGAPVTVSKTDGTPIFAGVTPTTLTLDTGHSFFVGSEYDVLVSPDGFEPRRSRLQSRMNGWYVGNILFGGLIGLLLVDPATGAMFTLHPTNLHVDFMAVAEEPVEEVATEDRKQPAHVRHRDPEYWEEVKRLRDIGQYQRPARDDVN